MSTASSPELNASIVNVLAAHHRHGAGVGDLAQYNGDPVRLQGLLVTRDELSAIAHP